MNNTTFRIVYEKKTLFGKREVEAIVGDVSARKLIEMCRKRNYPIIVFEFA